MTKIFYGGSMIQIDGSFGEGGGQILRTSIGLSLVTRKPFKIKNIRSKRKKPGLMRQHLTAVNAAVKISNAEVKGNSICSKELEFEPSKTVSGNYHFSIGTAGSATLVLQTLLPALMIADGDSKLVIEGGTHNPYSPPFHFLEKSFLRLLNQLGPKIEVKLLDYGFYPAGGGKIEISIHPAKKLKPFLTRAKQIKQIKSLCLTSMIPFFIAEKESKIIRDALKISEENAQALEVESRGPGNIAMIEIETADHVELISSFGEKGIPLNKVAKSGVQMAKRYIESKGALGHHLADQILIPLALAGGGCFTTLKPSLHTLTNIEMIKKFLDVNIQVKEIEQDYYQIEITGGSNEMGKT